MESPSQAVQDFQKNLDRARRRVFLERDLIEFARKNRERWDPAVSAMELIAELVQLGIIRLLHLRSDRYPPLKRYVAEPFSPYEVAISLKAGSFIAYGSAAVLHSLSTRPSLTVYANREQSPKPSPRTPPTQESITRAFANQPRRSRYEFAFDRYRCVLVSGKNSGNLGVVAHQGQLGETVQVTNVARTLIDIAVRPEYAGGIAAVLAAYRRAKGRVDVDTIANYLGRLDHAYPFHQAIGFYLDHAGFEPAALEPLRAIGAQFDFFLAHGMGDTQLEKQWRIFYPKGLI